MVTREEVKKVRNFVNKLRYDVNASIPNDILCAIDSMCADYEFRYDRSW